MVTLTSHKIEFKAAIQERSRNIPRTLDSGLVRHVDSELAPRSPPVHRQCLCPLSCSDPCAPGQAERWADPCNPLPGHHGSWPCSQAHPPAGLLGPSAPGSQTASRVQPAAEAGGPGQQWPGLPRPGSPWGLCPGTQRDGVKGRAPVLSLEFSFLSLAKAGNGMREEDSA